MVRRKLTSTTAVLFLAFVSTVGAATGDITTVAGVGIRGSTDDSGPAAAAKPDTPGGVEPLAGGGFLNADTKNNSVRQVAVDGTITTVAGVGSAGFSGDNGPATAAKLNAPGAVAPLAGGGFLIADTANNRIRQVAFDGTITTVAGIGTVGSAGDNGPATSAQLNQPGGV